MGNFWCKEKGCPRGILIFHRQLKILWFTNNVFISSRESPLSRVKIDDKTILTMKNYHVAYQNVCNDERNNVIPLMFDLSLCVTQGVSFSWYTIVSIFRIFGCSVVNYKNGHIFQTVVIPSKRFGHFVPLITYYQYHI